MLLRMPALMAQLSMAQKLLAAGMSLGLFEIAMIELSQSMLFSALQDSMLVDLNSIACLAVLSVRGTAIGFAFSLTISHV